MYIYGQLLDYAQKKAKWLLPSFGEDENNHSPSMNTAVKWT